MQKQTLSALLAAASAALVASPVHAATPTPPKPSNNPGEWIGTNDYPVDALKSDSEGTVGFNLQVGPDGVPTNCTVSRSSGVPSLDEATCRLISQRARFTPATDKKGRAVAGTYSSSVRWVMPAQQPQQIALPRRQFFAPAYCIKVWEGDLATKLGQAGLALCNTN